MKKKNKRFIPAVNRKIDKLLVDNEVKFIGKSADNLKAKLSIMPNFSVVLF